VQREKSYSNIRYDTLRNGRILYEPSSNPCSGQWQTDAHRVSIEGAAGR
jgi:hypothetical protein